MKTFELALGIILIVASMMLMTYWSRGAFLKGERSEPFEPGLFRNPIGTVVEIVLGLDLLAAGGLMLWLWSR